MKMTTITDTSILNWLPFDETGGEVWRLALVHSENQNWNVTDPTNSTSTLAMSAAAKHGTSSSLFSSPAHLGLATGLLLALVLNSRIWTAKAKKEVFGTKITFGASKSYQWILHLTPSSSFTFASTKTFILPYLYFLPLLAVVFLLPILSFLMVLLLPFALYRFAIQKYLQHRSNTQCRKKLFSGADAVWTFNESYESYSVINALIILEGEPQIDKLRHILATRLGSIPKLRMHHDFTLGYATWYEDPELNLESLVQWIPESPTYPFSDHYSARSTETHLCRDGLRSNEKWNRMKLCEIVESLCNRPLPQDHTVGWEALVGKAMPWEECTDDLNSDSNKDKCNYESADKQITQTVFPILFRIHHSVGDGASLLQLLMSALIDDDTTTSLPLKSTPIIANQASLSRPLTFNNAQVEVNQNERIMSSTKFPNLSSEKSQHLSQNNMNKIIDRPFGTAHNITHSTEHLEGNTEVLNASLDPNVHGKAENITSATKLGNESSFLYGRRLSGKKTILWDSTSISVEEIKKIRGATGVKFTEILLSAVSAALSSYWDARETGQLSDVTRMNVKVHENIKEGQRSVKTAACVSKSEDCRNQLTSVPEENEEEHSNKENASQKGRDKKGTPPSSVKLVLPAILGSLFQKQSDLSIKDTSELENLFSVAVMTLPVGESGGCPLERLSKVSDASGYMMPLRKDSIIDCGMKMKPNKEAPLNQGDHNTKVINKCAQIAQQELGKVSSAKVIAPDIIPQATSQDTLSSEENSNISPISSGEPEILTYYYTKEPGIQVKLAQEPDTKSKRDVQVQYHRYSDSTKVIVHEKEPYHCPTTIFFTQNSHRNISFDNDNKQNIRVHDICSESSFNNTRNDNKSKCSTVPHSDVLKTNIHTDKKGKISNTIPESVKTHEVPKMNIAPVAPIKFPSSPTIQHLLTRWLALDIVATVLPSVFAAPMMKVAAKGVAVVMSNLPGPPKKLHSILGGYALKDIVFWAPHRGYTGLGITVLSYDGLLHIGVMADDAVIPTQKGAQLIMDTILDELHSLRAAVSSSC